ncbi:hypothetical protein XF35_41225, partial [Streptomyces platensis subsp. clarensis]|nr:hypothetical protein [Streptomyces platensis subsp. clarensis]
MTTSAGLALALALSSAALAVPAAGPAGVSAPVSSGSSSAALAWEKCGPEGLRQECATLTVPLDYAEPDGRQATLSVSRILSGRPEARRGVLLVVPGGPGGSGVQRLSAKGPALVKELGGAYDLVAFDPRGVGGSMKADCGLADEDRHLVNLRSWPAADGSIDVSVARSRRIAEACEIGRAPL